jgi:hypothetical protein
VTTFTYPELLIFTVSGDEKTARHVAAAWRAEGWTRNVERLAIEWAVDRRRGEWEIYQGPPHPLNGHPYEAVRDKCRTEEAAKIGELQRRFDLGEIAVRERPGPKSLRTFSLGTWRPKPDTASVDWEQLIFVPNDDAAPLRAAKKPSALAWKKEAETKTRVTEWLAANGCRLTTDNHAKALNALWKADGWPPLAENTFRNYVVDRRYR